MLAPTLPLPLLADEVLPRKRFTRAEVLHMMELGLFEGKRYELIDGDLIDKMRQKPPHAMGVQMVSEALAAIFGFRRVRVQLPIETSAVDHDLNMPEPDVAVLRERLLEYGYRHPRGDELILTAEVSDRTLRHDSTSKRELYASAGVPEYWVVDVNRRILRVFRNLDSGVYTSTAEYLEAETIRIEGAPGADIPIASLLPEKIPS